MTVTRNEILTGINSPKQYILAIVEVDPELHKIVADGSVEETDRQYRTIWNKNWRSQRADLDLPSST